MHFLKNIFRVIFTSLFNYGSSFIIGLILPMVLTVADYGRYREYVLYLSFVYLLNLGYNDGIYIKYGGRRIESLDNTIINYEHNFMLAFQLITTCIFILISVIFKSIILLWFSISSFFILLNTYHQNFRKSVGDFKVYSVSNIFTSIIYVLLLSVAIFILKIDNYLTYIIITTISYIILFVIFEINFHKDFGFFKGIALSKQIKIFKVGIFILIGNMSIAFVSNIGNWTSNFLFDIELFAQYSFQNSLLNITLMIVNAVSLVFYNLISRRQDTELYNNINTICLLLGFLSGAGYYIIEFFVKTFIPQYLPSLSVLSITIMGMPFIIISNILINNLYKVQKSEKKYFKNSILFALISIMIVFIFALYFKTLESIAIGTLVSYIGWVFYNYYFEFKYINISKKNILSILSYFANFIISVYILEGGLGLLFYIIYIIVIFIFYKIEFQQIIKTIK